MNDDIEILDIFDNNKKDKEIVKEVNLVKKEEGSSDNNMQKRSKKRKRKVKTKAIQVVFCTVSFLFILGCIIFYGSRLIKYYRIYNPKIDTSDGSVLLAKGIVGNSEMVYEGSGLYSSSGNYIYKGDVKTNYLRYNNMLWRIVRINSDNSVEIILDDYISILPWHNSSIEFKESQIYNYLNKDFLNLLDKDLLVKNNYCEDKVDELSSTPCSKQNLDTYVKLLDINNFLNSVKEVSKDEKQETKEKKSYLVKDDEIFWLSDYATDKVWHTNGVNVSKSDANTFYEVRPVIKLNNTAKFTAGDGTIDNPYIVDKSDKLGVGSIVVLDNDKWIVYDTSDNVKLMKEDVLTKKDIYGKDKFSYEDSTLKTYLNGTYLDSLSYKDKLVEVEWYVGAYNDKLENIKSEKVKAKVGIPNILDIHFNSKVNGYFTSTSNNEAIWVYENPLRPSRLTTMRNIRPCIAITKEFANSLKYRDDAFVEE